MTLWVPVVPGVNLSSALGEARLTKKWVREIMRQHPEWDWRNLSPLIRGTYVNGEDAIRHGDMVLQVMRGGSVVATITFQRTDANEWGYQAVVT